MSLCDMCIEYIGVVSVYIQYNYEYYCDTYLLDVAPRGFQSRRTSLCVALRVSFALQRALCIEYISVVSVYIQYNYEYYCGTYLRGPPPAPPPV
jgi:hypothetical protein